MLWLVAPHWIWLLLAGAAVPPLARAGGPETKRIIEQAIVPAEVQPPDPDVITRALGALGIAKIDQAIRDGRGLSFPPRSVKTGQGGRPRSTCPTRSPPPW